LQRHCVEAAVLWYLRRGAAIIPIRLQLTVVLVTLVVAVSLAMIYTSYRAAVRSVEEEAVSGLETAAAARRDAVQSFIQHEQQQLTAGLRGIYLGCGSAGMMNPLCATEDLRRLVRAEHARAARLRYGKREVMAGKFAVPPVAPPPNGLAMRDGSPDGPTFNMAAYDPEGGLSIDVEFSGEVLPRDNHANTGLFLVTPEAIYETGRAHANGAAPESLLRSCGETTPPVVEHGNLIIARPVPNAAGACVVSWASQTQVLASVTRLRKGLARIALFFVLGALAIGYILGYLLTRPLTILTRRIKQLRKGDYKSPVPLVGSGELRQLAAAFGEMTASVNDTLTILAGTERRLSLACKAARLWLWQHDLSSGAILWFDPGADKPRTRTVRFRELLRRTHPDDRHAVCDAVRNARKTGEYAAQYRLLEHGTYLWVESWGQMMPAEGGKTATLGGVCLDATSRRDAEHLRTEEQKLLAAAEMASELAHQINNPLSAVTGAVYMAGLQANADPEMRKFLNIAEKEGKRLANIARQLVSLYTPSSSLEPIDVRELVDAAIASCGHQFRIRRDSLKAQLESTGRILGFREELRHAVLNLLTNAVEHSPETSRILVRTRRVRSWQTSGGRGVRITVANEGPGFPERQIAEMLEPFSGTKLQKGTGLGLWVTRSIIAKHGGKLRVRSTPKKTVCVVYLPAR
jgi:signal transduction histidine kinase/HAMP domain-containing protein